MAFRGVDARCDQASPYQERPLAAFGRTVASLASSPVWLAVSAIAQARCTNGGGTPNRWMR